MNLIHIGGQRAGKLPQVVDRLKALMHERYASQVSSDATKALISLENFSGDAAVLSQVENTANVIYNDLKGLFNEVATEGLSLADDIGLESFSEDLGLQGVTDKFEQRRIKRRLQVALEAGAIAAMAYGSPGDFARQAYTNLSPKGSNNKQHRITVVDPNGLGTAGAADYRGELHPALESFDERELKAALPYSVAFNVVASRQDDFSEAFFPTTVVTPDQAAIDVTVPRLQVFNEVIHSISGKKADFQKRSIVDAYANAEILGDENTRLIPVLQADNSNAAAFADPAVAAPFYLKLRSSLIKTAPLKPDNEVDLLGLSNDQSLIGLAVIDNTDSMDARIALDNLYISVQAGTPAIRFPTSRLPRNTFVKSVEGNFREMDLQFSTTNLLVTKDSLANDQSAIVGLPTEITSGTYVARLSVSANGRANVEYGNITVYANKVRVDSVQNATTGQDVPLDSGAGLNIVNAFAAATVVGYDVHAYRTNLNKRERGLILDMTYETERYTIPLASPISYPSPVTSNRDATDLKQLIQVCRVRNSNNAVTALLNYADTLRAYTAAVPRTNDTQAAIAGIQGMGRWLVKPYFAEIDLDLSLATSSVKSFEKAADVSMAIVNAVRSQAYVAYQQSYLQQAVDALTSGSGEVPTLVLGTDQVLIRHLMVAGDTRTFGTAFDKYVVKSTPDKRMYGKIIGSFVREGVTGPDPLSLGTHAWIPELTSVVQVSRNNATVKEAMVQPRTLHVCNLPVMFVINVKNLDAVLNERVGMNVYNDVTADGATAVTGNFNTVGTGGADGGTVPLDSAGNVIASGG